MNLFKFFQQNFACTLLQPWFIFYLIAWFFSLNSFESYTFYCFYILSKYVLLKSSYSLSLSSSVTFLNSDHSLYYVTFIKYVSSTFLNNPKLVILLFYTVNLDEIYSYLPLSLHSNPSATYTLFLGLISSIWQPFKVRLLMIVSLF